MSVPQIAKIGLMTDYSEEFGSRRQKGNDSNISKNFLNKSPKVR